MRYAELCKVYEQLEATSKRLEKTEILSEFLKKIKKEKNKEIVYLLRGKIFPDYDEREIGISTQLAIKALGKATGSSAAEITKRWKSLGDLGKVAEEITEKKKQKTLSSKELTTEKVLENLKKLPELQGKGTVDKKISLISELLTAAEPLEARYVMRTLLSDLRIGIGDGTLRDSIVSSCFKPDEKKQAAELVQEAYDKSTDFALVFEKACKGESELKETELTPGKPVKVMLFLKETNIKDGFERVGKPCIIDYKYDGFRMLINKYDNKIRIFTRRLEEVTKQFPEVEEYVRKYVKGKNFILDSEAVGFSPDTKRYKPFQEISQRIKRKYDIEKTAKELPVEIVVFDIIYYNGRNLLREPYKKRRKIVEKIVKEQKLKIRTSESIVTSEEKEAEKFFGKAKKDGMEGVMMKNMDAPYKPGARVGYGIKIKPEENEFDLVITGAEYGTGKRAGWLTSFDISCRTRDKKKFLEIGKVSTGLKEKEEQGLSFKEMTKKLKPLITKAEGRHVLVKPELVVTVTYQNIQKSPTYSSGFALRFPRFTRLRPDRNTGDIAAIEEIKKEYEK